MTPADLMAKMQDGLKRAEEHREHDTKNGLPSDLAYVRAYGYLRGTLGNLIRDLQEEQATWPKDREPAAENIRNALQLLSGVTADDGYDLNAAEALLRTALAKLEQ